MIADADDLFAHAKHYIAKASVFAPPHWYLLRAAFVFDEAASQYREAGLGLMARIVYGYATDCFGTQGMADESSRCKALADAVPVYWGEVQS